MADFIPSSDDIERWKRLIQEKARDLYADLRTNDLPYACIVVNLVVPGEDHRSLMVYTAAMGASDMNLDAVYYAIHNATGRRFEDDDDMEKVN